MSVPETIHRERRQVDRDRSKKAQDLLSDYDKTVYYPALKLLKERCASAGHQQPLRTWDNGLGYAWNECRACGARVGDAWATS